MHRTTILAALAILLVGLFHLATIRPGQDWGDDFALYIRHARNLSEGGDYADTEWIFNPANPMYSPRSYPPVYPLLLAPVYRLWGPNFEAMKVQQVVFLVLLLAVVYAGTRREMPSAWAGAVTVLLGLSPFLWLYKDRVMSEILFMLFTCLALHLIDAEPDRPAWRRLGRAVLAGVVVYLSFGTRPLGLVLVPCAVLADMAGGAGLASLRRWRWPGLASAGALGAFAVCVLVQRAVLGAQGSYAEQFAASPWAPLVNVVSLVGGADEVLGSPAQRPLRLVVLAPLVALVLYGYVACLRRRVMARELFGPLYLAAIVLWPPGRPEGASARYLLPLLPFAFLYLGHGAFGLARLLGPAWGRRAAVGLAGTVLLGYAVMYARLDFGPLRHGIGRAETQALLDHVRQHTPDDAVVVFSKPRALALLTGRRAALTRVPASDADLWDQLHRLGATHLVVGRPFPETDEFLRRFAERNDDRLWAVFRNRHFTVYRLMGPADDAEARAR
jgi:hypothetical protein